MNKHINEQRCRKLIKDNSECGSLMRAQHGMSMLSMLVILLGVGFIAMCGVKLLPAYMDYWTVKSTLESIQSEANQTGMTKSEIRSAIDKRFSVNRLEAISSKDIKFESAKDGVLMNAAYEKRIPLIGNIDVVLKFNELQFEISD